ncbi:uncharacterized protein A1O5_08965 [Cladophialophora psammophila CBS 110553]|uniref:Glutamine repeat protein-1 n=1 Tax=Cladophialophora psammophila CBS 110553 TaxID=1182543 RepID=W9XB12_9EURO|nr:uncharacterized protein A1O5_08965 [Cladophialophora psammophila CBS 110553]EXJ67619.1 hypothetical protein A1O5_08965 [Cladophialophora psammophila CBS 110553]
MNNPALPIYASQNPGPYAFSNPQPNVAYAIPPGTPFDHAQTPFQPGMIPNHIQRPLSHLHQAQQPLSQHLYQQQLGQIATGPRPESRSSYSPQSKAGHPSNGQPPIPVPVTQGTNPASSPAHLQSVATSVQSLPSTSAPTPSDMNLAANMALQAQSSSTLAQQAQIQNASQVARAAPHQQQQQQQISAGPALSPQSAARERARVTVLLEINTHLLQEVVSLQAQGKAGTTANQGQQSPTSPTSTTDPANVITNSPGEPPKSAGGTPQSKPPSQEYAECMRRLQANLSYLAAIADAKKKANGALPSGPAIMIPPPNLPQVIELYKKLNALFPEASQSAINKAMAQAAAQNQNASSKPPPSFNSAQG